MTAPAPAPAAFGDLVRSYLDLKWHIDPVEASFAGLREHDGRLGAYQADDVKGYVAALKSVGGAIEACHPDALEDEIDRTALLGDLRMTVHRFERERPHTRNPGFWISHVLEGLYVLLAVRDRPAEHRARGARGRLRDVPRFLQAARETLRDCPAVLVETARQVVATARPLVGQVRQELAPPDDASFDAECEAALEALDDYERLLEGGSLTTERSTFAIGEDAFNFRLAFEHALPNTASELWRYGHDLIASVEAELTRVGREIDDTVPWPDLVARLRGDHPTADALVAAYADEMERARRFVEERDLAPIPDGELDVVATPPFLRPLVPFAAYQPPGAFSQDRRGWFYVTPPDGDCDEVRRILRDHCVYEIASTALHEGYPGHHLQFLNAQLQPREVRRVIGTPLTVEGWALYCEEMMGEEGFYATPEEELFQRLALLWRAVRIVLDVGLHTRGMSFDDAVQTLIDRVHFDRSHAESEVRRYCAHPAYQLSYAVGRRELRALREGYRNAAGADYSLKRFHETVLAYGGLPVSLMRWGMGLG